VKELLNILLVTEDDLLNRLTQTICQVVEKYAPNRRWHIDSIIKVLTLAGNYVEEESIAIVIHLISATKNLQTYSVCKVFFSLREHLN
jgi:AP-1 complex subunit gamma-1